MPVATPPGRVTAARRRGFSLVEVIVAIGVLAVAVPVALAAMARASESSARARAENRAVAIVGLCVDEVAAAREGRSKWLEPIDVSGSFPDGVGAIAFTDEGRPIGTIGAADYRSGVRKLEGQPVRFLARVDGVPERVREDAREMRSLRVAVEYPAALPVERRLTLEFYGRTP